METLAYLSNIPETIKLLAENSDHVCITFFFSTAIWQPHGQLWAIIEGAASLT